MMDIIQRLKRGDVWYVNESLQESIDRLNRERIEAADEIERLREALKVIANSSEEWGAFAQEALQQKDSE